MQWTRVNNLREVFYALSQIKVKKEKEYFSRQTVKVIIIKKNLQFSQVTPGPLRVGELSAAPGEGAQVTQSLGAGGGGEQRGGYPLGRCLFEASYLDAVST